ncbi:hypothetical protein [Pontivivens insulae]|uniref:ATP-binding protein n=1 Tax=Pontivivens insulae TaxID=1639689 RepID=A0A2R8ABF0_9RHOB|nr:hypothetical protein [Pontivivens insulae]RED11271.1 hypothetical protein DFR53_3305 [Pontivivens insulae]SPF29556.1 hypothetical protein POI8812_01868 [Pontivivens insulae]
MRFEGTARKAKRLRLASRRANKAKIRKNIHSGGLKRLPEKFRGVVRFQCPKNLSIDDNFSESLEFFTELKELSRQIVERRRFRPTTPLRYSIGIENLETISVRCAVIFAAEIDRLRRIAGDELIYQGRIEDDNEAISLLRQLGVFSLVGNREDVSTCENGMDRVVQGHRTAIQLMSGLNCDEDKLIGFYRSVQKIFDEFQTTDFVHKGVAEAMLNAINHAYISKFPLKYPSCGKRWWAAAVMNASETEFKVIIYDQGHGIAKTLPISGLVESMEVIAGRALQGVTKMIDSPDEVMVKAALEAARTRTGEDKRGKGFKDIQAPVREVRGARLRITSGRAQVTLQNGYDTFSLPLKHHIGGTLIEWVFPTQGFQERFVEVAQ